MLQQDINDLVKIAQSYYKDNNLPIPNNVVEYISSFPKGMSRQMLSSKYGIKCSEFIKYLNPLYEKPKDAKTRALLECERLRYTILTDMDTLSTNRDKVEIKCLDCGNIHTTTIISLQGTIKGCPLCKSGNLPWHKRQEELDILLLDRFGCKRVSNIPDSQNGLLTVIHLVCETEYTTQLVGLVSPNSPKRGSCPNCRDSDRRVVFEGITFGSQFELECYKILSSLNPELHVEYSKYIPTSRRWVCDFKIGDYWIEVSNFKQDFKGYFNNIEEKRQVVENAGFSFFFVTSTKELIDLVTLI